MIDKSYFYSLKGLLYSNTEFTKEEGDKIWEEFLSSSVLDDLVNKLYNIEINIFKEKEIINIFKQSSYYFPNLNDEFETLSHKELMLMYFPPRKIYCFGIDIKKIQSIIKMIKKSLNKINIQHEWGNTSSSFLFFNSQKKYLNTQELIKCKCKDFIKNDINIKDEIRIKKEGYSIERLLYGRVINEINPKEAIYILDSNNYKKSLKNFCLDFNDLNKNNLISVFEKAIKNENIDKIVTEAFEEYKSLNIEFKENLENYSFKTRKSGNININLENLVFKVPTKGHLNNSYFVQKINPKFMKNNKI